MLRRRLLRWILCLLRHRLIQQTHEYFRKSSGWRSWVILDNDFLRLWGLWNSLSRSLYQGEVLLERLGMTQKDFRGLEKEWSRRTSYCWVSYNRSSSRYRFFTFCSTWTRTAWVIGLSRDQASTCMALIQRPSSKETMYGLKETHKAPVLGFWYVNVFAYFSGHLLA